MRSLTDANDARSAPKVERRQLSSIIVQARSGRKIKSAMFFWVCVFREGAQVKGRAIQTMSTMFSHEPRMSGSKSEMRVIILADTPQARGG